MRHRVYVVDCSDYNKVNDKIPELIEMMGGIKNFINSGEKIVLKPNLLSAATPEKVVSTHPSIVSSIGKLVKMCGAETVIADSPGAGYAYNEKTLKKVYETCGMIKAAKDANVNVNFDVSYKNVSFQDGKLIKHFEVISPVLEADGVINLCKLKTHTFMGISGAIKNNFGVIAGRHKPGYHAKLFDTQRFAEMLLDLAAYVSPRISIMDAVIGMEGDGPHTGNPRKVGLLLGSTNQLALDIVASEIMGISEKHNPVVYAAQNRGLMPDSIENIDVIGINKDNLLIPSYKLPTTFGKGTGLDLIPAAIRPVVEYIFKHGASQKPYINKKKCTACEACVKACPMNIISIIDGKYAGIRDKECIRCYCCHEMCSFKAIELRSGFLFKMLN